MTTVHRALGLLLFASSAHAQSFEAAPITDLELRSEQVLACTAAGLWQKTSAGWELFARPAFRAFRFTVAANGELYVVGGEPCVSGRLARFDAEGRLLAEATLAHDVVYDVALDARGERLVVACADGRVLLLEPRTLALQRELARHGGAARAVRFAPGRALIASAGLDGQILLCDLEREGAPLAIGDHLAGVECLAFSPDGERLASGARDGRVRVHDPRGRLLRTCEPAGGALLSLAWTSPENFTASTARGALLRASWSEVEWQVLEPAGGALLRALLTDAAGRLLRH